MLFAPDAGEVINIVAMAMKTGQDYTFLRDFIFTHPSMSEALNDCSHRVVRIRLSSRIRCVWIILISVVG